MNQPKKGMVGPFGIGMAGVLLLVGGFVYLLASMFAALPPLMSAGLIVTYFAAFAGGIVTSVVAHQLWRWQASPPAHTRTVDANYQWVAPPENQSVPAFRAPKTRTATLTLSYPDRRTALVPQPAMTWFLSQTKPIRDTAAGWAWENRAYSDIMAWMVECGFMDQRGRWLNQEAAVSYFQ